MSNSRRSKSTDVVGVPRVILLHFDPPYRHARHYIGHTTDVNRRIRELVSGRSGVPLVDAAVAAGSKLTLARRWNGPPEDAERLRGQRSASKYCPVCRDARKAKAQDGNMEQLLKRSIQQAEWRNRKRR